MSDTRTLSPADQANCIARAKQMVQLMAAARTDPEARLKLARQICDDAFTDEVPQQGAVLSASNKPMRGYARRARVPDMPPPPQVYENDDARTQLEQSEYSNALIARAAIISDNERKLRALLWARAAYLDLEPDNDFVHTLESAIRDWFLCSLPELPTETAAIEQCVKANAKASGDTLRRVKAERELAAAAE